MPLRVIHCPTVVGGHPMGLARAERELGLVSRAVTFAGDRFHYDVDEVLFDARDGLLRREWKRWSFLRRVMRDFDVVHFNFGMSIMPRGLRPASQIKSWLDRLGQWYCRLIELIDLPLLKRKGKALYVTFQGDDARQGDYCRQYLENHFANEVGDDYYPPEWDERKRHWIREFDRYADGIYCLCPDLLGVLPSRTRFIPYCNVDPQAVEPHYLPPTDGRRLVLTHAPSIRTVKGTRFVLEAVDRLRREGLDFEFRLVENLSHAEAMRAYVDTDLMIDQMLAGFYGGLGVEAMALGKPVLCYLRPSDLLGLPQPMRNDLPLINASPQTLCDTLRSWITNRHGELPELGRRSRRFVEAWHNPRRWARELCTEYEKAWRTTRQAA